MGGRDDIAGLRLSSELIRPTRRRPSQGCCLDPLNLKPSLSRGRNRIDPSVAGSDSYLMLERRSLWGRTEVEMMRSGTWPESGSSAYKSGGQASLDQNDAGPFLSVIAALELDPAVNCRPPSPNVVSGSKQNMHSFNVG